MDLGHRGTGAPTAPEQEVSLPAESRRGGYGLLNLSAGWTAPDAMGSLDINGDNVLNRRYQTFASEGFPGHSIVYGAPGVLAGQARTPHLSHCHQPRHRLRPVG